VLIFGGIYLFKIFNEALPFVGCMGATDSMGKALQEYAKEHDGKLPKSATWQDELAPYYAKFGSRGELAELNKMKSDGPWGCWNEDGKPMTGFAFNSDLSGKPIKSIKDPQQMPVIFEVPEVKRNNSMPYKVREHSQSPKIVLGQRRGWLEVTSDGEMYLLVPDDKGSMRRVPVNMDDSRSFDVDENQGIEVKTPSGNEPAK
jgi:hypothetical protein